MNLFRKKQQKPIQDSISLNHEYELVDSKQHNVSIGDSVQNSEIVENTITQKDVKEKKSSFKRRFGWKKVTILTLKLLAIVILALSLIRIPGFAFIDSVVFSLLLGWTKYVGYFVLFLLLLLSWWPKAFKKIFSLKIILYFFLFWIIAMVIISSVGAITVFKNLNVSGNFNDYFLGQSNSYLQHWLDNDWAKITSTTGNWLLYLNPYGYGGLPSFFFVVLFEIGSPYILITLSGLLFFTIIGLLVRKTALKMHKEHTIKTNDSELTQLIHQKNKLFSGVEYRVIDEYLSQQNQINTMPIGSISNLTNVTVDNRFELKNTSEKAKQHLDEFFTNNEIEFIFKKIETMYQSFTIVYDLRSKRNTRVLHSLEHKLESEFSGMDAHYWFDNHLFYFTQKIPLKSSIAIRDLIKEIGTEHKYCLGIGNFSERRSYYVNALHEPNIIIYGCKGSGRSMVLSNIILSLAIANNTNAISMSLVDLTDKTLKNLEKLPQVKHYASTISDAKELIQMFVDQIKDRIKLIESSGCQNIYEYALKNNYDFLPIKVLVINNLDNLFNWDFNVLSENIKFILENAQRAGFINIFSCEEVNDNVVSLNQLFNNIICLKVDNVEQSNKIINNPTASYLWGNGDGFLLTNQQIYHIQTAFVNRDETSNIINEISTNLEQKSFDYEL